MCFVTLLKSRETLTGTGEVVLNGTVLDRGLRLVFRL